MKKLQKLPIGKSSFESIRARNYLYVEKTRHIFQMAKDFNNYWFETGTPTFLVDLLKENDWYLPKIERMQATEAVFSVYELENLKPEALLFQTGYVTIKDETERLYTFGYPNQ